LAHECVLLRLLCCFFVPLEFGGLFRQLLCGMDCLRGDWDDQGSSLLDGGRRCLHPTVQRHQGLTNLYPFCGLPRQVIGDPIADYFEGGGSAVDHVKRCEVALYLYYSEEFLWMFGGGFPYASPQSPVFAFGVAVAALPPTQNQIRIVGVEGERRGRL
jgi:hypothetical protein